MASSSSLPTIAIFGATGGCCLAVLKNALKAGHSVNVLARSPSKLSSLSASYPSLLHITEGDISNLPAIKSTLVHNNRVVDVIVSGIGMTLHREGMGFTSNDVHICEKATSAILQGLKELEEEGKVELSPAGPSFVAISTTGISKRGRDVPIAMLPLYHWMLAVPHADKKKMEDVIIEGEGKDRRWIIVRPSLLVDGEPKGLEKLRVGIEVPGKAEKKQEHKEVGYTIRREDVGLWIYEECIKKREAKWEKKMVSLTY
jgi:hypothetical protein